jgi:two-component sensor histidine kinase
MGSFNSGSLPTPMKDPAPVLIGEVDGEGLEPPLKATVKAEGIGALAFIPLTARGELVGKFMTYYDQPHEFTDGEIELAVTLARQLGFSVERMQAEEARQLLVKESAHRVKNLLATVQAIAGQSLREMPHLDAFQARLRALGEAHDLLLSENWDQAPLAGVVRRALKPFGERFLIEGPATWLPAQSSLMLSMCLHELATNAAKYGALSNGRGKVEVTWKQTGNGAVLTWRETGGPRVVRPERKGFGSLLIERSFGDDRKTCFEYRRNGLICNLELREWR